MDALGRRLRRHRLLAGLAFGLLALAAEIVGSGLIQRIDLGRHVASPGYAQADFYPPLLAAVKVGIALLAARLAWRFARARALERAGLALLAVARLRHPARPGAPQRLAGPAAPAAAARARPRLRLELSPRLTAATFVLTSLIYLVQADVERLAGGERWPLLAPLLHTSALPVFAVLAVVVAVLWRAVAGWLAEYEAAARATLDRGRRCLRALLRRVPAARPAGERTIPALRLLAASLHQRPPPLPA